MGNPWFILIVLIPAYVVVALAIAVIGAIAAPLFHRSRARFFTGFGLALQTALFALVAYAAALGILSYIPAINEASSRPGTPEVWFAPSLIVTLVLAMVWGFYLALRINK